MRAKPLLLILALLALAGCERAASKTPNLDAIKKRGVLIVGGKHDVPKFGFKNPSTGQIEGFESDLIRLLARELLGDEKKAEIVHVTAATRMGLLKNREIDFIMATMTVTEERKKEVDFGPVYYTDALGILTFKDGPIKSLKDLNGKTVAVQKGSTGAVRIVERAREAGAEIRTLELDNYVLCLQAVQSGRAAAMATDRSILLGYAAQDPRMTILPERLSSEPYAPAFRKDAADVRDWVTANFEKFEKAGVIKALMEKHGIS
ncbi:MAG TPA: transporter substrate-binding domain-containing protein [Candidatus Acidoferrales bacterium]|nr:transporter substrate-binding domain-containing protein [Candidatus Acidoferrales bacterium]